MTGCVPPALAAKEVHVVSTPGTGRGGGGAPGGGTAQAQFVAQAQTPPGWGKQGSKDNLVVAGGAHRPAATRYLKRTEGRRDMRLSAEDMVRE